MENLGMPNGSPTWFQDFTQQSGPQQGQAGYYADQYTDIANQYGGQLAGIGQQYGQDALYNPAFLRTPGFDGYQNYNPFDDQGASGTIGQGQQKYDWEYNNFSGLSDMSGALDYLGHYSTHGDAARKNESLNDQNFFANYGGYGNDPNVRDYGYKDNTGGGHGVDGKKGAIQRAQQDYNSILNLQQQYGGY